MKLRSYLTALTLATLLPVAIFAVIVGYLLVEEDRRTFRRGSEARALAMLTAIDAALAGDIGTLEAIAALPQLDAGDLASFRQDAERVLKTQPHWATIVLALPSGQQVMDLRRPPGATLPDTSSFDPGWRSAVQSKAPLVSNLIVGPISRKWEYAVRVPVLRDGVVRYVLSAVVVPAGIAALLERQGVPARTVAVVLDRNDRIVARTVDPDKSVGQVASQSLRDALRESQHGWFRGSTIEGAPVYTPYRRSEFSGWAFAMGIPASAVDAAAWRAGGLLSLGLLAALVLAFMLAWVVGRRISQPIQALAAATEATGRGERFTVTRTDIAEIQGLAVTLEESIRALKEADRAKDEFLAMLSHELRNPLAALTTAAHVLRVMAPGSPQAAQARAVVHRQSEHMARLIEDLLDVSRVTMGKVVLEREPVDLAQAVTATVSGWRLAGRLEGRAAVSVDAAPAWARADAARIEQIVSNLLDNALKFTPPDGSVVLSVRRDGGEAALNISDTGRGIARDELAAVFGLFTQGDHSLHRSQGGLGIGLALVKRLAELHGGSVSASSAGVGRGASFTVRLPAIEAPAEQPAAAVPPRRFAAGPRRVLVIEDNADTREMLRTVLVLGGHEVRAEPDGAAGIAAAAQARPDVALIDIGLPDMDGYEVAKRLRAAEGGAPIGLMALTGYGQAEDQRRAREAGFDAHRTTRTAPDGLQQVIAGLR